MASRPPRKSYPPALEKFIPIALTVIALAVVLLLIVTFLVALGLFPSAG